MINQYIKEMKERYSLEELSNELNSLKKINALAIGDCVIDRYTYVLPKGRAMKDSILSTEFVYEEDYAGGVLALANHLSSYVDNLHLVTLLGSRNPKLDFIRNSLAKNICLETFSKEDAPTTIKQRYVDADKRNKLFKVEYMNDEPISKTLSNKIGSYLLKELPKYDMVIALDYSHGFFDKDIRKIIQDKSKFLCLDVQLNSANIGYSYVSQYEHADFIVMNEREIRLPMMMRFDPIEDVASEFYNRFEYPQFLVTLGSKGCLLYNQGGIQRAPILTDKLVDTIGAGDAVFSLTSLFAYSKIDNGIIPFIANCAGGIDANIVGNKEFVSKDRLLNFIKDIYDGVE